MASAKSGWAMKLRTGSKKAIIIINFVLSCVLGVILIFGFINPELSRQNLLQTKLTHLMLQAQKTPVNVSERMINFAELLKILKRSPLAQLEVLNSTQEQGVYHLSFMGQPDILAALIQQLADSTLVMAQLVRTAEAYELNLTLKDLRVDVHQEITSLPEVVGPKVVGSVTQNNHHYCVLEDAEHKIHLSDQVQC